MAKPVLHCDSALDRVLAAAMRGDRADLPPGADPAAVLARIAGHGIAGLLAARGEAIAGWPPEVREGVRAQALASAMWDARHRSIVAPLLGALAHAGVGVLVLKGTALAHDLYARPADRARGDTDLLVAATDAPRARAVLAAAGFMLDPAESAMPEALRPQELWLRETADGGAHEVDLHFLTLSAPALAEALPVAELFARAVPLPRLGPAVRTLGRADMLLHLVIHRAVHRVSPHFTAGRAWRGGDRLIWLVDIALVAGAMERAGWDRFVALAARCGAGAVGRETLASAEAALGARVPPGVLNALAGQGEGGAASIYLLHSGAAARAWRNLLAVPGARARWLYLIARVFPPAAFMRAKYPAQANWPLALLHLRRIGGLWGKGRTAGG